MNKFAYLTSVLKVCQVFDVVNRIGVISVSHHRRVSQVIGSWKKLNSTPLKIGHIKGTVFDFFVMNWTRFNIP